MFTMTWEDTQDQIINIWVLNRVLHYAFSSNNDDALNNTIFSDYAVINNSQNTYTDFYVG